MDAKDSKKEDQPKPAEQNGSSDDKKEIKTHIPIAEFVVSRYIAGQLDQYQCK